MNICTYIFSDGRSMELCASFAYCVDELKMIHSYNLLSGKGESHESVCWTVAKAIAQNLYYRTKWPPYTDAPDFSINNMSFTLGTDTADKDWNIGPRLFMQVVKYLEIPNISLSLNNYYGHKLDLSQFNISVNYTLFII